MDECAWCCRPINDGEEGVIIVNNPDSTGYDPNKIIMHAECAQEKDEVLFEHFEGR